MKKPKMILFDYGHTLLCEPGFDFLRGYQALFPYVVKNPRGITVEQCNEFSRKLWDELVEPVRESGRDVHELLMLRLQLEYQELELSVSIEEAETILWNGISAGAQMPGVTELLTALKRQNIRSGVISNTGWSGRALQERINRLIPENQFEFVIASSEYLARKPSHYLFELALRKANLSPGEVWYCGDNVENDVLGAHGVGIFPVWYNHAGKTAQLDFPHLEISDWSEMVQILEE